MVVKYRLTINEDGTVEARDAAGKPVKDAKWLLKALGDITEEKHKPIQSQVQESVEINNG